MIFPTDSIKEIKKFWSFIGLVELIAKYHDKKSQEDTLKRLIDIFWLARPGKNISQEFEKGIEGGEADFAIKSAAVNVIIKKIPHLNKFESKIKEVTDLYYSQYGTGKLVEGFKSFLEDKRNESKFISEDIINL